MNKQYRKQSGFTLMELFGVVAVSSTLAALSVPMINDFSTEKSVSAIQSEFVSSVQMAREASLTQGMPVSLCPSANGKTCSSEWKGGWIVFLGGHTDKVVPENILHSAQFDGEVTLDLINESPELISHIKFNETGFNATANRITATFCDTSHQLTTLTIERTGRVLDSEKSQAFESSFLSDVEQAKVQLSKQCSKA